MGGGMDPNMSKILDKDLLWSKIRKYGYQLLALILILIVLLIVILIFNLQVYRKILKLQVPISS